MRFLSKVIPLLLALVLAVNIMPLPAAATGGSCGVNIGWSFDGSTLTLSGSGPMFDYQSDAFGHTNTPWAGFTDEIETVILAGNITHIGNLAFNGCSNMKYINFPKSVTSIGGWAFYYCKSLTGITLPENLTDIGPKAFQYCKKLTSIAIPKGVTVIEYDTFASCDNLMQVTLPEGLTTIGDSAFQYCDRLDEINIPDSVTSIGEEAFEACYWLGKISIPKGVTVIEKETFSGCWDLEELILQEGLITIGDSAFENCNWLKTVTIPDSVKTIGKEAFCACDSLSAVTIGSGVTAIDEGAFLFSEKLTDVYYNGTQTMWNQISIGADNEPLLNAAIHFAVAEHTHSYSETVTPPTCTEQGYTTYTCGCGESYVGNYVNAAGHAFDGWNADENRHWHICVACGQTMDKTNHDGKICTVCGYATPDEPAHDGKPGDVNHDGKINAKDATLILQKSVGVLKDSAKFCETCAEVSGDGKLNAKDSTLILQHSVGLRSSFPIQE